MRSQATMVPAALAPLILALALVLAAAGRTPAAEYPPTRPAPRLYVFISASLPEASLRQLARQAAALGAPLLLRGLVGASLQETVAWAYPLRALGAALEIDPLLFEAYEIAAVPAVVLTCDPRGEGPHAVVYGLGPTEAQARLRHRLRC